MIEFNGSPLFGKDSSPQNNSAFFALIGTIIFLLIFILCLIFIKPSPQKEKYKEVQIVLDTSPIVKEKPKEEKENLPKADEKKEVQEVIEEEVLPPPLPDNTAKPSPVEENKHIVTPPSPKEENKPTPKPKPQPKPQPKPTPKVEEEPKLYQSMDDLLNQQFNTTPKKNVEDVDWDAMFEDDTSSSSSSSSSSNKVTTQNTVEGSAGSVSSSESQRTTSQSQSNNNNNYEASSNTSDLLKDIKNTKYTTKTESGTTTETSIQSTTSDDSVFIKMDNGKPRRLIKPASPTIVLSEEAMNAISGSPSVSITITVINTGNVNKIEFFPEASLPLIARTEIKNQLLKWQFDPASYTATAHFEYNIVKR